MSILNILIRNIGDRKYKSAKLKVTDDIYNVLKNYNIEIVKYNFINTTSIFAIKENEDIESSIFIGKNDNSFKSAIIELQKKLKVKRVKKIK